MFLWDPQYADPADGRYYADVPGNWWRTDLPELTRWNRVPDDRDDLYFVGTVSVESCVIPDQAPAAPSVAFAGIHLLFGHYPTSPPGDGVPVPPPPPVAYSGTVTVEDSLAVGVLEVECGQVEQADEAWLQPPVPYAPHAGTLTVTSSLDWTGGTLNSSTTAGYIDLAPGATGVAEPSFTNPGINGTVYLGSELRLRGDDLSLSSQLTLNNGTYILAGGQFHAMGGSLLLMAPAPKVPPPNTPGTPSITIGKEEVTNPAVKVDDKSTLKVTTVGRQNNTDKVDVKVNGGGAQVHNQGTVIIESYTRLIMAKQPAPAQFAHYLQNSAGGGAAAPITKLQAGSEIKFENNGDPTKGCVELTAGELLVYGVPGVASADQSAAGIVAPADPTAPALFVGHNARWCFTPSTTS